MGLLCWYNFPSALFLLVSIRFRTAAGPLVVVVVVPQAGGGSTRPRGRLRRLGRRTGSGGRGGAGGRGRGRVVLGVVAVVGRGVLRLGEQTGGPGGVATAATRGQAASAAFVRSVMSFRLFVSNLLSASVFFLAEYVFLSVHPPLPFQAKIEPRKRQNDVIQYLRRIFNL